MRELTDQELVRREKMDALRKKGINPFGGKFDINSDSKQIADEYTSFTKEQLEEKKPEVIIAGRIVAKRRSGKAGFMHVLDKFGKIQIYININSVGEENYELYKEADLGDIIGIEGYVFRTNTGELSIHANKYIHLVKALRPLPEKFHGLTDTEERFRRRYVDLIVNEEARNIAFARPKIIRKIQEHLDNIGYVEVETPVLGTILGGASARPFITHHNTLDIDMYLRIATELPLKRLIVGGMDAVYEIGRIFRNEGMDRSHNPEFTTIELYKAYADMEDMMNLAEDLFRSIAKDIFGTYKYKWKEVEINLEPKFRRVHMVDLIKEKTGINFFDNISYEEAKKLAEEHNIEVEEHFAYGHIVEAFFERYGEEAIKEPTFVYGHPIEISPLATKSKDPRWTERFELFIGGSEFANAFTELNDPIDQYERFLNQTKERELGNEEANEMDMDYVEALEYGMPPAGGMGIGIDRMVMLFTNSDTIREVILFPTMKNKY
ncbi:MAG: lysine--tRNA ligase [Bacilli bacterium]|nr:lysine--tRNA ligase [Bacilli bacterium]